jgi:hypothetical protein
MRIFTTETVVRRTPTNRAANDRTRSEAKVRCANSSGNEWKIEEKRRTWRELLEEN